MTDPYRFPWYCGTALLGLAILSMTACQPSPLERADFVATIPPLQLILNELTGSAASVACILPPGASPHSYELRPSTARLLENAKAVFYVDDSIDGWAAKLAPGRIHPVFSMLPEDLRRDLHVEHHHGEGTAQSGAHLYNAHFWSDPIAVRAIVPELVSVLSEADPANGTAYTENGARFIQALEALDQEYKSIPVPKDGYALVAFHPSWCYYFERYGIQVRAYVEPFPGKEPTPQAIQQLEHDLAGARCRVVLSETQLPAKSATVLAETLGARVAVIDPLGGQDERMTYADLLHYNATRIYEVLQ